MCILFYFINLGGQYLMLVYFFQQLWWVEIFIFSLFSLFSKRRLFLIFYILFVPKSRWATVHQLYFLHRKEEKGIVIVLKQVTFICLHLVPYISVSIKVSTYDSTVHVGSFTKSHHIRVKYIYSDF